MKNNKDLLIKDFHVRSYCDQNNKQYEVKSLAFPTICAEYPALRRSCGIVAISSGNPLTEPGNIAKFSPVLAAYLYFNIN